MKRQHMSVSEKVVWPKIVIFGAGVRGWSSTCNFDPWWFQPTRIFSDWGSANNKKHTKPSFIQLHFWPIRWHPSRSLCWTDAFPHLVVNNCTFDTDMDDEIHVIVTMGHIAIVLFDKLSLPVDEKNLDLDWFHPHFCWYGGHPECPTLATKNLTQMIDPIQLSSQYHWRSILSRIHIRSRPGYSTGPSKPGDKLRALQSLRSNKKREKSLQVQEEIPMKNWRNPWRSQWKMGKS